MTTASHQPTVLDVDAGTIPQLITWAVDRFGDTLAVIDGDERITYTELGVRVDQAARAMVASGIAAGDTVGLWAPNCWQWVVAALATSRVGASLVPVNTRFKGGEAGYVLATAKVKLLFVVNGFLGIDYVDALTAERPNLPHLAEIVDLVDVPVAGATPLTAFVSRGSGADADALQAEVDRRSAAVELAGITAIMFTSGTTGLPKGVLVRGSAIIRAFSKSAAALGVQPGDPFLLVNPYFHAFGYNCGIIKGLITGATNIPVAAFDATAVMELIQRERIAVFPGPPAVFQSLLNHPDFDSYDLSSLRACMTGAATIPVEMVKAMKDRLGFTTVITAFGMTETSGLASFTGPDDSPELVATTSGRAIPDVELKVVDDDLNEVPRGTEGELLVRGYQVTPGYLDNPEATAEAITPDGWLRTGDIAVMDDAGYIDITDRKKDMFIMGGFNAYPAEIERMMIEHPEIGLVAVIGVPDERMGEVGAAFVIPAPGASPSAEEIIEWCREKMANYKVPRFVWFVDQLPMTASGKVQKPELRALSRTKFAP
ncbi:MAG: AMP-binding protein [Actinomycetota bacterium]|nr:AMP-binding protein [Actinomycetota bacterium]